jgi:transposase
MARSRPPYPAAFRQQMLEMVKAGQTPAELAREFECTAQTIANRIAQTSAVSGMASTQSPVEDRLTRLEREKLFQVRRESRQL